MSNYAIVSIPANTPPHRFIIAPVCLLLLSVAILGAGPLAAEELPTDPVDVPATVQQTQIWEDGTKYIGPILNGKREGKGTIIWPDGTRYSGEFKNDLRDGAGTMVLPDGTVYNGVFVKGELVPAAERQPETGAPVADLSENQMIQPHELFPPVNEINDRVKEDLHKMLNLWAAAWSEKNIEQYLASYHDNFEVPGRLSRRQWEILRRSRIKRPDSISIQLKFGDMAVLKTNMVQVQLTQEYQSNVYADVTRKTMVLQRDDHGSWLIISEDITN